MKIAIVGAMEEEVEILRREIGIGKVTTVGNCEFIEGKVGKHQVIVTKSGIGKETLPWPQRSCCKTTNLT